ncbi:sulfite exporter TauE/SafE family protein [uncultured Paraglaciecola sp.]|uniref:sulfite exporter TauE/SafE family protein n=1 Tax=uncultured Paraglaciecola sp. TaxID=1765024 RepID=UPI0030D8A4CE|tara:strand:+ start:200865 stop:201536 length:672 start_codon:yes stop_codon:yes gene_type:complete
MNDLSFVSALLIGLAGGVHCVGMCGGIVGAFAYAVPKNAPLLPYTLAYNLGRITSYTLAGAITGWAGLLFAQQINKGIVILQFVSGVFLLLLGLYIAGWWQGLTKIEKLGSKFWQVIHPWSKTFIPFKSPLQAIPYGMIWGWLPCGLVYSVLTWSLASGSAVQGAIIMAGFGLGTLPVMILMATGFNKIQTLIQKPKAKILMGLLLLVFATMQLLQAISGSVQ